MRHLFETDGLIQKSAECNMDKGLLFCDNEFVKNRREQVEIG